MFKTVTTLRSEMPPLPRGSHNSDYAVPVASAPFTQIALDPFGVAPSAPPRGGLSSPRGRATSHSRRRCAKYFLAKKLLDNMS